MSWEDIGEGVSIEMMTDARDRFTGLAYRHPDAETGGECRGTIYFDRPWVRENPTLSGYGRWEVDSWEPLTVSPSLLCSCGHHGFIKAGRWVPAGEVGGRVTRRVLSGPPGTEGSVGPFPEQYGDPHVYARDVTSGSGDCVCGASLPDERHTEAAPGVPVPDRAG